MQTPEAHQTGTRIRAADGAALDLRESSADSAATHAESGPGSGRESEPFFERGGSPATSSLGRLAEILGLFSLSTPTLRITDLVERLGLLDPSEESRCAGELQSAAARIGEAYRRISRR